MLREKSVCLDEPDEAQGKKLVVGVLILLKAAIDSVLAQRGMPILALDGSAVGAEIW